MIDNFRNGGLWLIWFCLLVLKIPVPIGLYGFQHYISMLGSLVLIPLVIVPAMGGTYVSILKLLV